MDDSTQHALSAVLLGARFIASTQERYDEFVRWLIDLGSPPPPSIDNIEGREFYKQCIDIWDHINRKLASGSN